MDLLIDEIVKLLGGVLAGALIALVVKLLHRVGLQINEDREKQLRAVAVDAIARVEEWAASHAKRKLKTKITGADKLESAVADIIDRIPGVSHEEAEAVIHSMLPHMNMGAAAGTREIVKAIRTR